MFVVVTRDLTVEVADEEAVAVFVGEAAVVLVVELVTTVLGGSQLLKGDEAVLAEAESSVVALDYRFGCGCSTETEHAAWRLHVAAANAAVEPDDELPELVPWWLLAAVHLVADFASAAAAVEVAASVEVS